MKTGHFPNRRPSLQSQRGFTLVELLVVIAILAVLLALLAPTLRKAVEQARRATCASSQHGMGVAYNVFAAQHDAHIPLGCAGNSYVYQASYDIWRGRYVNFGILYKEGCIAEREFFYCPTQTEPQNMFNMPPKNEWNLPPTNRVRAAYNSRPIPEFPWDNVTDAEYESGSYVSRLPSMTDFDPGDALVVDLMRNTQDIERAHLGDGLNVLNASGSVQWRDSGEGSYEEYMNTAPITSFGSGNNAKVKILWEEYFDE